MLETEWGAREWGEPQAEWWLCSTPYLVLLKYQETPPDRLDVFATKVA